ncbi:NAD(P)H-dependent oxidoreductase [Williamsia sp.]|uniref:NAD(P)H-dependent oxidoreductase n=1 Tax=Williamsia sp. TaxID=1872085 RepID=UPI002F94C2A6
MASHSGKKVLWVHGHPRGGSLNHQLVQAGSETLGHVADLTVVDLHAVGWNPVLSVDELAGVTPDDVAEQQQLVRDADLLVVQFPMWWHSMPAIVKGWFDRVFAKGFAFGIKDPRTGRTLKMGDGGLVGRRALTIVTAGDRPSSFAARGINGDVDLLLFGLLHGTFWYSGIAPLEPHLIAGTDQPGWDGAETEISRLAGRLRGVFGEPPIPYRTLASGDYGADRILDPGIAPRESGPAIHVRCCG